MADLVTKYERIATEPAPPTPCKSTSKRAMSLLGSEEQPRPPPSPPAVAGGPPLAASSEGPPPGRGGRVAGDHPSCCRCDRLRSAVKSRENLNKRKRFSGSEAENLKFETEDKTCADGNLRRETPAPIDARRRPETPPGAAPGADAAKVKSTRAAAEVEAYLSAVEREQQRRFAEKYNYDVVNDVPLEGRYEWIPLNVGAVEETLK